MAVGVSTTKINGRLIFDLVRDGETTSRAIEIPYSKQENEFLQTAVNQADSIFASSTGNMNLFIQPANWRDSNDVEEQWTTTGVRYELISTTTTPIEPD